MKYTINELANSKGVSQPVREALLQMEAVIVKANAQAEHFEREWYLRGDELEATNRQVEILSDALAESRREVDAMIAVARADERWEQSKRRGVLAFCPYTGKPRHPSDIASDPHGILILVPDQPLQGMKP
jgi:hypothetical protein